MIKLSLIILNWNGRDHLARCLESIKAQATGSHEVIVVDNASVDDSIEVARRIFPPTVIIQRDTNGGFCEPNNAAARQASGEYLVFLNNDIIIGPEFFTHLENAIADHAPDLLAVRMLQLRKPDLIDNCGIYFTFFGAGRQRFRGLPADHKGAMHVQSGVTPSGACFVIRRKAFLDLGGFDEVIFFNHEDLDLGLRAQSRGLRCLYSPLPTVLHYGSASADIVGETTYYYVQRNMELVFVKNLTGTALLAGALPHLGYLAFQLIKACWNFRIRLFLRAKRDALKLWQQGSVLRPSSR